MCFNLSPHYRPEIIEEWLALHMGAIDCRSVCARTNYSGFALKSIS